eukprot:9499876-Pyramimonas_sp.AAC.3
MISKRSVHLDTTAASTRGTSDETLLWINRSNVHLWTGRIGLIARYFAYGSDTSRFCLEQWGIQPLAPTIPAAARGHKIEFTAPGICDVFEPAFANLVPTDEPKTLAHGALIKLPQKQLARMRQGDAICGGCERHEDTVKVITYDLQQGLALTHKCSPQDCVADALPSSR